MFGQLKLENHRGHIALFCITLCCTALFWIVLICIAAFILLATAETSAAKTLNPESAEYQNGIDWEALTYVRISEPPGCPLNGDQGYGHPPSALNHSHSRSIDNSRTQV